MRILFLPRYAPQGASSRYRIWQYVPSFERAGHTVEVHPLLDAGYLTQLYAEQTRGLRWLAKGYARRLITMATARRYDAIICEQEAFPYLPAIWESLFHKNGTPLFLDFDDAAHIRYEASPLLRHKIPQMLASAEAVVVGNNYLAQYARKFTQNVSVIPSVVDLSRYPGRQNKSGSENVVIAWIGIPATAEFLRPLFTVYQKLQDKYPQLQFRFIGTGPQFLAGGLNAEFRAWSQQSEAMLLAQSDIGIMPLPDTQFTRGKCGLKLIQYMASHLPVVASPVGANCEIVVDGENGFLADGDDDWFAKLSVLIENPELRRRFGAAGRRRVEQHYSLESGFAKWTDILDRAKHLANHHANAESPKLERLHGTSDPLIQPEECAEGTK
jgi:glycosyltransferase involved in cell wall biosynthesis